MKLIDILVRELPTKGGWPSRADTCGYGKAGGRERLHFAKGRLGLMDNHSPSIFCCHGASEDCLWLSEEVKLSQKPEDSLIITKEQYEAALVLFENEAVPPVGSECEFNDGLNPWTIGTIKYVSKHSIVIELKEPGPDGDVEPAFRPSILTFRPLRTEEERQREETIASMLDSLAGSHYELDEGAAEMILDAIAQGKVSGIKLAD